MHDKPIKANQVVNQNEDNLIYRFFDSTVEITLTQYLSEVPSGSKESFVALKTESDNMWLNERRANWRSGQKCISLENVSELPSCSSAEDCYFQKRENEERDAEYSQRLEVAHRALNRLSQRQCRRFLMYYVMEKTPDEIARIECVSHQSIHESIRRAQQLIAEYLTQVENTP